MDKNKWMNEICKAKRIEKFSSIVKFCAGKNVLDVGCVGQDLSFENEGWLHSEIKKVAKSLIGADINQLKIDELNAQGFEIYLPEQIEKKNLRFDLIVMGDVIEHVNDPGAFLEFYAKFLNEEGEMIICTPNVFGIRYILQVLIYGKPGTNEEHTVGFDPYVMLELFSRINLMPTTFFWLQEYKSGSNWKQKIILGISTMFIWIRKYFNSNFMFIVKKVK